MRHISYDNSPSLYLIPTPIGNMEDITYRSLNTLKMVDIILCEDTRESLKLLNYYDINKKLVACHEFNESTIKEYVLNELKDGKNIGLITDQGTPIISDPGYIVSRFIIEQGYNVISLPGATAFVPALTSSGLEPSPFLFYGFLNSKQSKMKEELNILKDYPFTFILYEAPHRLNNTLKVMLDILGDRKIAISREISKIHEDVSRGTISEFVDNIDMLKGEFVLVVEGNKNIINYSELDIIEHVNLYISDGLSEMDSIKKVARDRNVPKSEIYKYYHKNK